MNRLNGIIRFNKIFILALVVFAGIFFSMSAVDAQTGKTAEQYLEEGEDLLLSGSVNGVSQAYVLFQSAKADYPNNAMINTYLAIARLGDLLITENPDGFTSLLGLYGVTVTGNDYHDIELDMDESAHGRILLPDTAPSLASVSTFMEKGFIGAINDSIADLDTAIDNWTVSDKYILDASKLNTDADIEFDYADLYLLRAMLKGAKSVLLIPFAHNMDVDSREVMALINADLFNINALLERYENLLKLKAASGTTPGGAALLLEARTAFSGMIDDYLNASENIRNDPGTAAGAEEIIEISGCDLYTEQAFRNNLLEVKDSIENNRAAEIVTTDEVYVLTLNGTSDSYNVYLNNNREYGYYYSAGSSDELNYYGRFECIYVDGDEITLTAVAWNGEETVFVGTLNEDNITEGFYYGTKDGEDKNGDFTVAESTINPKTSRMNFNKIFGNGSEPGELREFLPQFNKFNEPVAGTAGHGLGDDETLGGIVPDQTQEDWGFEGRICGEAVIPEVADGAIAIDGNMADWSGISAIDTDVTGDAFSWTGMDTESLYLAEDNNYLYALIKLDGPPNENENIGYSISLMNEYRSDSKGYLETSATYTESLGWDVTFSDSLAGTTHNYADTAGTGADFIEFRVPLADTGEISGRYIRYFSSSWSWPVDNNYTGLKISPASKITGTLNIPGYDGQGPVYVGVYSYNGSFNTEGGILQGYQIVYPEDYQSGMTYSITGLPAGVDVFVNAWWDADFNGVLTQSDHIVNTKAFTTSLSVNQIDIDELNLYSLTPPEGLVDHNLNVEISGTGFNESTRVSLSLDTGSKRNLLSSLNIDANWPYIAISGNYAFITAQKPDTDIVTNVLYVVDIGNPSDPQIVGTDYIEGGFADDIAVSGDYVYLPVEDADAVNGGLYVIDVSDPSSPEKAGFISIGAAGGISVSGNYAYTGSVTDDPESESKKACLNVIDISVPSNLKLTGIIEVANPVLKVSVSGSSAYIIDTSLFSPTLSVIDISIPSIPQLRGSITVEASQSLNLGVSNGYAYFSVADFNSIMDGYPFAGTVYIIDLSDPANLQIIKTLKLPSYISDIFISDSNAYLTGYNSGMSVVDITSPSNPNVTGSFGMLGYAYDLSVSDNYAFVCGTDGFFNVIDISNSGSFQVAGSVKTAGPAAKMIVSGDYAYVPTGESGLQVVDIRNPMEPAITGSLITSDSAVDVFISGNYAQVVDSNNDIQVINISDPSEPLLEETIDLPDSGMDIFIAGSYAFVGTEVWNASPRYSIQIFDISNPSNPQETGSLNLDYLSGVAVSGNYAYIWGKLFEGSSYTEYLGIIDISDPSNPIFAGSTELDAYYSTRRNILVSGNYAYITGSDSLLIIDVSDPENPVLTGSVSTSAVTSGFFMSGAYAYVANDGKGVVMIDISNPATPVIVGSVDTPGRAADVFVSGGFAYVADCENGIVTVPLPFEADAVTVNSKNSISVSFPAQSIPGYYNLRVFNDEESVEQLGVLHYDIASDQNFELRSGWNLVSMSRKPLGNKVASVLNDITDNYVSVWSYSGDKWFVYDPKSPDFSDLREIEPGKGYWINMDNAYSMVITGADVTDSIDLADGWNLVGYNSIEKRSTGNAVSSIQDDVISVWSYENGKWYVYDPDNPDFSDLIEMKPGLGYWINTAGPCEWLLP